MLKINRSILIICMVSLFLIIGQISASDTDSIINDSNGIEHYDTINISQERNDSIEINGENEESIEIIEEKQMDTRGIVMANDNYSCGPASLATVLNKKGLNLSLDEVSQHTNTCLDGTSMQSLIDAARYYNFSAYGVAMNSQDLKENFIVHLNIDGCEHWTVINKVTESHIFLADSSEGNMNLTIDEFNSYFTQKAIILSNDPMDLRENLISNRISILDKEQCQRISGKGLKRKVVGYRIVWKYGFIQKYGWVLRPKVVGGHVSFSQWEYVKGHYTVWGKYKAKEPIYKYYFSNDDALTSAKIKKTK